MTPVLNRRLLFTEEPIGRYPTPGKTTTYDATQEIDIDNVALNGGFLVKTLVLSIDPYIKGRMHAANAHLPTYALGKPLDSYGIGVVIRSENPDIKVGDHLYGSCSFEEHFIRNRASDYLVLENKENLPWSLYVGAIGLPGQTAYSGWKEHANPKKGEVAFVTAGAGGVGSLIVQLAKRDGLKVIASAGTDEKVGFLKDLGADVAFNYKTSDTLENLKKEGPIDIYWDNVGGQSLEAALATANTKARFIECGMISGLTSEPYLVKNLMNIIIKQITISGFLVNTLFPKHKKAFYAELPALFASGELKYKEDATNGLEEATEALVAVLKGASNGKGVVLVGKE
ncbi:NAD-P-binding protein [Hygrophoropsis aurantiaca]|uniref:NAD-P-binding protein n=1 Tax=Hygrophoropsis aurantiaca TaxID=72124 RepID=A0ACB8AFV3_9AGAM|nr:NAD-P-binding protein [Hygrophoropsis aurantiaca]